MKAEEDFGIIANAVTNMSLFHLDAIQGYALAVERDIRINGLLCSQIDWKRIFITGI